jgi:hypothetical protein
MHALKQFILMGEKSSTHLQGATLNSKLALSIIDAVALSFIKSEVSGTSLTFSCLKIEIWSCSSAVDTLLTVVEGLSRWTNCNRSIFSFDLLVSKLPVLSRHSRENNS